MRFANNISPTVHVFVNIDIFQILHTFSQELTYIFLMLNFKICFLPFSSLKPLLVISNCVCLGAGVGSISSFFLAFRELRHLQVGRLHLI